MRFSFKKQKNKIYFWERIAFRILTGFTFPILLSAYALFYVSNASVEMSEREEAVNRNWTVIHVNEGKALLSLTKLRMNSLLLVNEPALPTLLLVQNELKQFQSHVDTIRRLSEQMSRDTGVNADGQLVRLYRQLGEVKRQLAQQVDKLSDAMRRQSMAEALPARREIDRTAIELEYVVGKLNASNQVHELGVVNFLNGEKDRADRVLGFFLVAVFFFGTFTAIFVSLSITAPIRRILLRVKDIATGDGDLSKRVTSTTGGELNELAAWMNLFLEKTQKIIATISNASDVVRQTTEQVSLHSGKMTISASGIGKNMMEQSMNLDECTGSISSIDDLLHSSGESTRQAASLSRIAMDRALQGGASVHETIEAMEKIEESARKIEQLVSSINDIASQTNLLAINAAIEATKAGDHGKGFAVVAEEVRKLAERARKLTGEVTSLMGESGVRVKAGVNLAKGAGVSLDGIIKDVEAVSSLIQRVAASSSKQAESSSLVLEFMKKVSDAVRTNLTEIQEVTRSTELTTLEVNKLDSLVTQLNEIVGQFQAAVLEGDIDEEEPARPQGLAPMPAAALSESESENGNSDLEERTPALATISPPPLPKAIPGDSNGGGNRDAA